MKTKISPPLIGLFVLGAIAIGVVALLSFGGARFFSKPQQFIVYFDESIHGLDVGSPVKLRGVRIGRVADLSVCMNRASGDSVVAVVCELNRSMITNENGEPVQVTDAEDLDHMISKGLRAQLGILGLATGLLFVELDFLDPALYPSTTPMTPTPGHMSVVPSVPSASTELQSSLTELISKLKSADIGGLLTDARATMSAIRAQAEGLQLRQLSEAWTTLAKNVNTLAASPETRRLLANLDQAVRQLSTSLAGIENQIEPAGAELRATLADMRQALRNINTIAESASDFLHARDGLGADFSRALRQLTDAAASVGLFMDFLERNPNALLTGRPPQEKR
ncbi:MAG: MlaD family protein [Opitutaceae bacterium]|jgi:paraquat-inducible protein B|nr:MlaD family protein [Opitutaceae bacterium]